MRETCGSSCTGGPPPITDTIASSASLIAAINGSPLPEREADDELDESEVSAAAGRSTDSGAGRTEKTLARAAQSG